MMAEAGGRWWCANRLGIYALGVYQHDIQFQHYVRVLYTLSALYNAIVPRRSQNKTKPQLHYILCKQAKRYLERK